MSHNDRMFRLKCSVCKNANYYSSKNRKLVTAKMDRMKFCRHCRKKTKHKEVKLVG